jgi:uncharacterized membrane protein YhaH (DUF805 family)
MDWQWLFASFEGRINRGKFWAGSIVLWVLAILATAVVAAIFGMQYEPDRPFAVMAPAAWLVWLAAAAALAYASLAVLAKRWHDRDKSGWWSLILLVPFIGVPWTLIECGFLPGTPGPNRYGADPLGEYEGA